MQASHRDSPRRYSISLEALVTAGPRKLSVSEYESVGYGADLCEDGAGVLLTSDGAYFWLADGASDGPKLIPVSSASDLSGEVAHAPYFPYPLLSARILSQDLGRVFSDMVLEAEDFNEEFLGERFRREATNRIIAWWEDRFKRFLNSAQESGTLSAITDSLPTNDEGNYLLDWSSTFLAGSLTRDRDSNLLRIRNFGDCSGLVVERNNRVEKCEPRHGQRIFMRCLIEKGALTPASSFKFSLTLSDQTGSPQNLKDVSCFMFGSDGFAKGGPAGLVNLVEAMVKRGGDVSQSFRDLARNYFGKVYDDKALVVGRVVQVRNVNGS